MKYIYYLVEMLLKIMHGDYMKYRIKRYRLYGAQIGDNVRAFSRISSAESYMIKVGNNVTVSTDVKFLTHDNSISKLIAEATDLVGRIVIGDNVFIGAGSIILPGVTLGDNCIVGAGSVVTKSFPNGVIIAGNPARVLSSINVLRTKSSNNTFDFRGLKSSEKREKILNNRDKWVRK